MTKWEYCYIVQRFKEEKPFGKPKLCFTATGGNHRREEVEDIDMTIAVLGTEGWEMLPEKVVMASGWGDELDKSSEYIFFKREVV